MTMKKFKLLTNTDGRIAVKSPFIIAAHHTEHYPKGNDQMGPSHFLKETNLGEDFNPDLDFRMYYGKVVPGFPAHPHRGIETVTLVLDGTVDHTDSLGSMGRYQKGDVQWMTAGAGIQHCEMFPLLKENEDNRFELIQIWLNLPKKNKFVLPYYQMLWKENIPVITVKEDLIHEATIKIIAGDFNGTKALKPNPDSWANDEENKVKILLIDLLPHAKLTLKGSDPKLNRMLYLYEGPEILIENEKMAFKEVAELKGDENIVLQNLNTHTKLLLLEGMPINEPISARGPFVMNTDEEIMQAYKDFRETQFGGWPWKNRAPVHSKTTQRFAQFSDGTTEYPNSK